MPQVNSIFTSISTICVRKENTHLFLIPIALRNWWIYMYKKSLQSVPSSSFKWVTHEALSMDPPDKANFTAKTQFILVIRRNNEGHLT